MKVFIVRCGYDDEDNSVLGVYSTRGKAIQAVQRDKTKGSCMGWYNITEWEIDKN